MKNSQIEILIADDERNLREVLVNELSKRGYNVAEAGNGLEALDLLEKKEYDVLLLDLNMPGLGGIEVLKKIKYLDIPTEVIVLTAYATVSTAVEAMKLGAYDYLTKPFNLEELATVVEKAYEKKMLVNENVVLKSQMKRQFETGKIVTKSKLMLEMLETVKKVAVSNLSVLINGESGVGKEIIAKTIHNASERIEKPFTPINCGAIPENMLESELFGHEKGAFTGAYIKKLGLLEIANNGTLFLDEIGEMPLQLQTKLLRVIETGKFFRVGGTREVKVDVRFVSATNKDIKAEVEKGNFRSDLYYRLTTVVIQIPPLRERKEDIPALVEHFIDTASSFRDRQFSKKAMELILNYSWPGNVRELQNVVQRTLLLSKSNIIDCGDLPADLISQNYKGLTKRLADIEKKHILNVLKEAHGHQGNAAEILGISPKTLYRKLHSYGVKG